MLVFFFPKLFRRFGLVVAICFNFLPSEKMTVVLNASVGDKLIIGNTDSVLNAEPGESSEKEGLLLNCVVILTSKSPTLNPPIFHR